jgi:LmbE family N-acetylglucosaminyl deacetylase
MSDPLEPLPEDWTSALAVVAHPDDMEYGAASAVARWTSQGKDIRYLLVTAGEAGISSMSPAEVGPLRRQEQIASCAVVGVDTVEFLEHPDGLVVEGIELRRDLAAAIRRHRPEVLLSINHRDSWGGPSWNHADHRAVGRALLDAARDAGNPWTFSDTPDEAWNGVRFVAFSGSPMATHAVDVTDHFDAGVDSLRCHEMYLRNLGGDMADPDAFLRSAAESTGAQLGVPLAASFEVVSV